MVSPLQIDPDRRLFVIQMQHTSFACGITPEGHLVQLHWGGAIAGPEDLLPAALAVERSSQDSTLSLTPEVYAPRAGLRFGETALAATFADGTRETTLQYVGFARDDHGKLPTLVLQLRDPLAALVVDLAFAVDVANDCLIRWATITNAGSAGIVLDRMWSALWHVTPSVQPRTVTTLAGLWMAETQIQQRSLVPGTLHLESRRGIPGPAAYPWFAIDEGATQAAGAVYFGTLAWSGNWEIRITTNLMGLTTVGGGINADDTRWHLAPGAAFTTPPFIAGYAADGYNGARQRLHRHCRAHVLPQAGMPRPQPLLYNSWEATYFDVTVAGQEALAERAARIGLEDFVVDDGWFIGRDDDRAGLGDWQPDPAKFPDGLGPLIAHVRALGMRFGLWVEPEMVNPRSMLYQQHPDWIYHFTDRPRSEARNQLVLNLGREDVRAYLFATLDGLLRENAIDFIKWDMNRPISEAGWPDHPELGQEIWVRHVQGVYALLDALRAAHPNVRIESCASGGNRADYGILSRTDEVWTSDNTDPEARLLIQEGASLALPARVQGAWVTESTGLRAPDHVPLAYRFHVSMLGTLGVGGNLLEWSDEDLTEAAHHITRYKQIRHLVQDGDQRWLTPLNARDITAIAYVAPDRSEAVVFAFRPRNPLRLPAPSIPISGLMQERRYRVSHGDHMLGQWSGAALAHRGVTFPFGMGAFASGMLHIHALP